MVEPRGQGVEPPVREQVELALDIGGISLSSRRLAYLALFMLFCCFPEFGCSEINN